MKLTRDDIVGEWVEPTVIFNHDDIVVIKYKYNGDEFNRYFHSKTDEGILCYADGSNSTTSGDGNLTLWEHADYTFRKYEISDKL